MPSRKRQQQWSEDIYIYISSGENADQIGVSGKLDGAGAPKQIRGKPGRIRGTETCALGCRGGEGEGAGMESERRSTVAVRTRLTLEGACFVTL